MRKTYQHPLLDRMSGRCTIPMEEEDGPDDFPGLARGINNGVCLSKTRNGRDRQPFNLPSHFWSQFVGQAGTGPTVRWCPVMNGHDTIVMNFGQHPMSQNHWTFQHYQKTVDAVASWVGVYLQQRPGRAVVWVETTAQPTRFDVHVNKTRDWRTRGRIDVYNSYATSAMIKA
eukprot:gene57610-biopygen39964